MHSHGQMTPDQVRTLADAGETFTVEFKRAHGLSDSDLVTAVVCLANGAGGTLLLGVEDDGRITGLPPRHGSRTDPDRVRALVINKTEPPVSPDVEIVQVDDVAVAVITVEPAATPVGTKAGVFVRRSTQADGRPECVPYRAHELISAGLSAQGRDYAETRALGLTLEQLDPGEFQRFRQLCASGKGDGGLAAAGDEEILRALRLIRPDTGELTLGAALLFGTEHVPATHVPTAEVLFQESRAGAITSDVTTRAPLLRVAERIKDLIDVRNTEQEVMLGLHRVAIPRLPDGIVREAVANALVHRDYAELGPIRIQLDEDQFRVSSPGGFPPGITFDNLLEDSRPRSVILAETFKRAGIVDRYGRGVQQMYLQLLRLGRDGPDYSGTNDKTVVVTIPTSDADLEMVRFVIEHEERTGNPIPLRHLRVLHELKANGQASLGELVHALATPEARVRAGLARLTEAGLVEPRGHGRSRRYHLTAAFYRTSEASAYVRLLDTDPIQQDQMVLSYVDRWGSITRAKAAELCRLSPTQARGVLKRLVERGELELRGERRGAHYVRRGAR